MPRVPKKWIVLLAVVCSLLAPSAASASTTLGPLDPNPTPDLSQAVNWPSGSLLFTAKAVPGVQLTAPGNGVITSWQFYTDDVGPEVTAQLRILAPAGEKKYAVVGAGAVEPLVPVTPAPEAHNRILHAFKSQVPIAAGQIVGVSFTRPASGSFVLPVLPVAAGWEYGCLGPGGCTSEVPTDTNPVTARHVNEQWLAMNAQFESDVDGDGLGDESQDPCVGICTPPLTPPASSPPASSLPAAVAPTVSGKKCPKGKRRKRGKCVKKHKKRKHHKAHVKH